uniref:Uncharacterized protein n=1 Tax=Arundo donax TaxID=35708 RepID=A0A0A8ZFM9_ARUDO
MPPKSPKSNRPCRLNLSTNY